MPPPVWLPRSDHPRVDAVRQLWRAAAGAPAHLMDPTFTLVIVTVSVGFWTTTTKEVRLPGYSEIECKLLASQVARKPNRAYCEREAEALMPVICPFGPPCWQARSPNDVMRPVP
jgi:hypothetical protein